MLPLASLVSSVNTIADIDMSYWNQGYNKRKQKEQTKKQEPLKPVYPRIYNDSYSSSRQAQQEHDRFCWRVGFGVIAILTGFFIWGLIEIL